MSEIPALEAVPALLSTQLMAAEVYAYFLRVSSEGEQDLWKTLLDDELDHVAHLRQVLRDDSPAGLHLPDANADRMRESCEQIKAMGKELFLMRLEGALRLECAELDYGLEGLAARRLKRSHPASDYPGDISSHIMFLIGQAERYTHSRNIGLQIRRLRELLETSLTDTAYIPRDDGSHIIP